MIETKTKEIFELKIKVDWASLTPTGLHVKNVPYLLEKDMVIRFYGGKIYYVKSITPAKYGFSVEG